MILFMGNLIPKLSVGSAKGAVLNDNVLAVGTAILFSSLAAAKLTEIISGVPFLQDYVVYALIGVSVVILIVAVKMKSGFVKAITIGLAGGSFFIALMQVSSVRKVLASVPFIGGKN